jgi:hypothetical protein
MLGEVLEQMNEPWSVVGVVLSTKVAAAMFAVSASSTALEAF